MFMYLSIYIYIYIYMTGNCWPLFGLPVCQLADFTRSFKVSNGSILLR